MHGLEVDKFLAESAGLSQRGAIGKQDMDLFGDPHPSCASLVREISKGSLGPGEEQ